MGKGSFTRVGFVVACRLVGVLYFVVLSAMIGQPNALAGSACYQHHFLGDYPSGSSVLGWSDEAQGLTHDSDNWYVVENVSVPDLFRCNGKLWRIPITNDMDSLALCGVDDVSCTLMSDEICDAGYNHAGDPAYYAYGGQGYVLVPLEEGDPGPAVAVYKADSSLDLVGWQPLNTAQPWHQTSLSWLAVDPDGYLYAGNHDDSFLQRYHIDGEGLTNGNVNITFVGNVPMLDENGNPLVLAQWQQGGAFAEDMGLPFPLLYLLNGNQNTSCDCGIHVFEIRDECVPPAPGCPVARRVDKSTNGYGDFNYEYYPEDDSQEPEGLTFWNLDADGRAPGISGQLHAILLDNPIPDGVYVKHYRLETDNVPPAITCPSNTTVECTGNNGIEANDPQLAPFFGGASATDECDNAPLITNDAPPFFPLGSHEVDFTAQDYFHNASSCSTSVLVRDTQDPTIVVTLDRTKLWPPDHKLVTIHAHVTVSDVCDPNPTFVLTSITSNEPDNGLGDGDTANDIQGAVYGTPDVEFQLRAERSGKGAGRVYTVVYTAYDGSGNSSQAVATVVVPHDQGK